MKRKYIISLLILIAVLVLFYFLDKIFPVKDILSSMKSDSLFWRLSFFLILIPSAIADSINPCEFAVMFILLNSVMKWQQSKKKVIAVWSAFILAVFLSYFLMWLGLYNALTYIPSKFERLFLVLKALQIWSSWFLETKNEKTYQKNNFTNLRFFNLNPDFTFLIALHIRSLYNNSLILIFRKL